jgi:hypothetical protein
MIATMMAPPAVLFADSIISGAARTPSSIPIASRFF